MDAPQTDFSPQRFSTADLPERDRVPAWREFFAPRVFGGEIEPLTESPIRCQMTIRRLPGLTLVSAHNSPLRFLRTSSLLADGRDDYGLHLNSSGCTMMQRGRELACGPGDAALVTVAETGATLAPHASRFICLNVSRTALKSVMADPDGAILRPVPSSSEALRYLLSYLRFLETEDLSADSTLARSATVHLYDLLALVLGASRDMAAVAENRGLRAARLAALKRFIGENLGHRGLNVSAAAARHGLTPRTVQRMFEQEGTTFSEYVLDRRLAEARRMLSDGRYAGWTVSAIALEAGFGDLSYFNRRFRRRFGAPPGWFRSA